MKMRPQYILSLLIPLFLNGQLFKTSFVDSTTYNTFKSDASSINSDNRFNTWSEEQNSTTAVTWISTDGNTESAYGGTTITEPNGTTITPSGNGCLQFVHTGTGNKGIKSQMKNGIHTYGRNITIGFWAKVTALAGTNSTIASGGNKMKLRAVVRHAYGGSGNSVYSSWKDVVLDAGWTYVTWDIGSALDDGNSGGAGTRPAYAGTYGGSERGFRLQFLIQTRGTTNGGDDYRGTMLIDDITITGITTEFSSTGTSVTNQNNYSSGKVPSQYESLIYPANTHDDDAVANNNFYLDVDGETAFSDGTNGVFEVNNLYITNTTDPSSKRVQIASSNNSSQGINTLRVTGDLDISAGAGLTLAAGSELIVLGNLVDNNTSSGNVVLKSESNKFSSLKVAGTSSGNFFKYQLFINDINSSAGGGWDLKGSPLDTATANGNHFANNGSGSYAFQAFDNSTASYTQQSTSGAISAVNAKGYAAAKNNEGGGGTVAFTGQIQDSNTTIEVTNNVSSSGDKKQFNLIANPFSTFIAANAAAKDASDATVGVIYKNALATGDDVMGHADGEDVIWAWNGSSYSTITNAGSASFLAPGQGFFISMDGDGDGNGGTENSGVFDFLESFQTTIAGMTSPNIDDFVPNTQSNRAELFVEFEQGSASNTTEIYFLDNCSDYIDATYDGAVFGLINADKFLFTRSVKDDKGVNLAVQALNYSEISDKVIPLGINTVAGENFKISIKHNSLPENINIYLEDTYNSSYTNLKNQDFVMFSPTSLSDVGRFNLITTPVTLSVDDITNNNQIRIYKSQGANYITVDGLSNTNGDVDFKLYNITGALVMSKTLDSNENRQQIVVQNLSKGVYYASLNDGMLSGNKILID